MIELVTVVLVIGILFATLLLMRNENMSDKESLDYLVDEDKLTGEVISGNDNGFSVIRLPGSKFRQVPTQIQDTITRDETYELFINGVRIPERIIIVVDALENSPYVSDTIFKINNAELGYQLDQRDDVFVFGHFEES